MSCCIKLGFRSCLSRKDDRFTRKPEAIGSGRLKTGSRRTGNVDSNVLDQSPQQRLAAVKKEKSGGREIRTPGTLRYAGFQNRCNRPLCHPSGGTKQSVMTVLKAVSRILDRTCSSRQPTRRVVAGYHCEPGKIMEARILPEVRTDFGKRRKFCPISEGTKPKRR